MGLQSTSLKKNFGGKNESLRDSEEELLKQMPGVEFAIKLNYVLCHNCMQN